MGREDMNSLKKSIEGMIESSKTNCYVDSICFLVSTCFRLSEIGTMLISVVCIRRKKNLDFSFLADFCARTFM